VLAEGAVVETLAGNAGGPARTTETRVERRTRKTKGRRERRPAPRRAAPSRAAGNGKPCDAAPGAGWP
jgi:hypothetical protein